MKALKLFVILSVFLVVCISNAYANTYGTEITIYDGVAQSPNGINNAAPHEDNETGTQMYQSQAWDLEGFFLNGKNLTIVGGFNFYTGHENMMAGDIFIDTNGDAVYSPATISGHTYSPYEHVTNGLFKYDYVLDVNWAGGTFNIVQLHSTSILEDTAYGSDYNIPSNPWIYLSGADDVIIYSGIFSNYGKASMADTGFDGWSDGTGYAYWTSDGAGKHYVATFDINAIDLSNGAVFHNTMECGNDNLMGKLTGTGHDDKVPEPATMLLLGLGLLGVAAIRRKF